LSSTRRTRILSSQHPIFGWPLHIFFAVSCVVHSIIGSVN
jgi:hypothetical protein